MALREFALGLEALHRFVDKEPSAGFTSACSVSWRWKESRWIRGCELFAGASFESFRNPVDRAQVKAQRSRWLLHSDRKS